MLSWPRILIFVGFMVGFQRIAVFALLSTSEDFLLGEMLRE